jgi:hypothetical protein
MESTVWVTSTMCQNVCQHDWVVVNDTRTESPVLVHDDNDEILPGEDSQTKELLQQLAFDRCRMICAEEQMDLETLGSMKDDSDIVIKDFFSLKETELQSFRNVLTEAQKRFEANSLSSKSSK